MLVSTSVQNLNKMEKHQDVSQDSRAMNEVTKKNPSWFMDLKQFPELKTSGNRNQGSSSKSKSSGFMEDQKSLPVVSNRNKEKSNVALPSLPGNENMKKGEVSTNVKKKVSAKVVSKKNDSGSKSIVPEKEMQFHKCLIEKKPLQESVQPRPIIRKTRKDPIFINLEEILARNKIQEKIKKKNGLRRKHQRSNKKEILSGNILDSSNPKRYHGKHREIQKKKLTNFKLTIIKERILKSKMRENAIASQFGSKSSNLLDTIDFNSEIKIYLNQLKDKKPKNSNKKQPSAEAGEKKIKNQKGVNVESKLLRQKKENRESKLLSNKKENVTHKKQIPQITAEGEIIFSSKFKEYCDNVITPDLNSSVIKLIEELIRLQDKLYLRDPIKAKNKKRHVSGIREVRKYLNLKKVKLIIIAPNLEKLQMEGSVYDSIYELKSKADSQNVPYGFALDRFRLGRCTKKNVAVSAFAVLNPEGLEDLFADVLQQLEGCKSTFAGLKKPKVEENDVNSKVLSSLETAFQDALQLATDAPSVQD